MKRVRRLLPTFVFGSVRSTRASSAAFELEKWYTPNTLATEPGLLTPAVTLSRVIAYSPASVICLDRYETMRGAGCGYRPSSACRTGHTR